MTEAGNPVVSAWPDAGGATAKPAAGDGQQEAPAGGPVRANAELLRAALSQVYDPEIGIDIVSLGLIYDVEVDAEGQVGVDMTLTSPYCPMGGIIQSQVEAACAGMPGITHVTVNLVWTPPWEPRTMASEEAKLELGIY